MIEFRLQGQTGEAKGYQVQWDAMSVLSPTERFGSKFTQDFYTEYDIWYNDLHLRGKLQEPMRLGLRITHTIFISPANNHAKTIKLIGMNTKGESKVINSKEQTNVAS